MRFKINYTANARKYAFRHPLISAILIQINFWILAFLMLSFILHFASLGFSVIYDVKVPSSIKPIVLISLFMGFFYGLILGFSDFFFYRKWFKGKSTGILILLKSIFYFLVMVLMFIFLKEIIWQRFLLPKYFADSNFHLPEKAWNFYFKMTLIYVFFMSILISFIIQVNTKFGPGVLIPLLLGRYANPKEEERIFIFLDLKSSTTHAEKLGHVKYSKLIRDCFLKINYLSVQYGAEIYQYVGDEVVLSWPTKGLDDACVCIDFYFACKDDFLKREKYYLKKHGVLPEFKAGLHYGLVTAVEVGDVKREIAFHGDTLNVTARIQEKCNSLNSDLIISQDLKDFITNTQRYKFESQGEVPLKGRKKELCIYTVTKA
ncbi:MAG: adenylate/guanylate cyclase domain-containing protein [Pelobium sp.]